MDIAPVARTVVCVVFAALLTAAGGCNVVGPSCRDENGAISAIGGQVALDGVASYSVTSPKNSNLFMRLTWPDTAATLGFRATITDCGTHVGCAFITVTPPFGPGGSSPTPQPWPPGLREMQVDGSKGKTWRIEITGDSAREASFTLDVSYRIACER
jgi:hypothetical protein